MKLKPVLIDFDGVIRLGNNQPAADASLFLKFLTEKEIPSCIISNSTLRTSKDVIDFLSENNINFGVPAMTAADAALHYVKTHYKKVSVYCIPSIKKSFEEFVDDENPEAVVIGDIGDRWNYEIINKIFKQVFAGADIIAMHWNRYWHPDGINLSIDAGAFIKAIEYAANKESILIGKPSPLYFEAALNLLGYSLNDEFFMIGDDVENDVNASQSIGGTGVLIYTGKTKYPLDNELGMIPGLKIHSLTEMINFLENSWT
jgi:HAD superfamily hydrolase (TIGR01458 family)